MVYVSDKIVWIIYGKHSGPLRKFTCECVRWRELEGGGWWMKAFENGASHQSQHSMRNVKTIQGART